MDIPDAVRVALGRPVVEGEPAQAFLLLTSDSDGYPHIALLSSRQLTLARAAGRLRAVVWGSGTSQNLARSRRCTVLVVAQDHAYSLSVEIERQVRDGSRLAFEGVVRHVKDDTAGVPLHPLAFDVAGSLAREERWDLDDALLAALDETAPGPPGS